MFGEHLKKIRIIRNRTQQEVAEYINISTQSISKWENNLALPSIEFLPKLAKFFSCPITAFFYESKLRFFENFNSLNDEQKHELILSINNFDSKENVVTKDLILSGLHKCLSEGKTITLGSVQRNLNIGYAKAGEIIDFLHKIEVIKENPEDFNWIIQKEKITSLLPFIDQLPEYLNVM